MTTKPRSASNSAIRALAVTSSARSRTSSSSGRSSGHTVSASIDAKVPGGCDRNTRLSPPRHRWWIAAASLAAIVAGCTSTPNEPAADTGGTSASSTTTPATPLPVTIAFTYKAVAGDGSGIWRPEDVEGGSCGITGLVEPTDTLHFMEPGTDVVLADAGGDIVAKAPLSNGSLVTISTDGRSGWVCGWAANFDDVPASDFYTVTVNGTDVGTLETGADLVEVDGELLGRIDL